MTALSCLRPLWPLVLAVAAVGVAPAPLAASAVQAASDWTWDLPDYLPPPRVPADNPMTQAKVALGRYLFYDTRLSGNGTQACATCHLQKLAFTDGRVPETPDVVLLGGAGPEYSHLTLSRVYEWMAQGVPVVAMHRSTAWTTTEGLRIDTGMYLIGMEETSGRNATAVGKPAPAGFLTAAARLGVEPEDVYMVGDDLNNDVLAAQVVGMTGVLVRTGKFRQDTLDRWATDEFAMQPNHVLDSVADLPGLLGL